MIQFIRQSDHWDRDLSPALLFARAVPLLKQLSNAYSVMHLELEDDHTARIRTSIPDFFQELLLDPAPIRSLLENNQDSVIYWRDLPQGNVFEDVLLALSSAMILPLLDKGKGSLLILGWSDPQEFGPSFREFATIVARRLHERVVYGAALHVAQQSVQRLEAVFRAMPQAIVFIDTHSYSGWINDRAAALLGLPLPGQQAASVLAPAMTRLRDNAVNREEINALSVTLFSAPGQVLQDWLWHYETPLATTLKVASVPIAENDVQGRLWLFEELKAR